MSHLFDHLRRAEALILPTGMALAMLAGAPVLAAVAPEGMMIEICGHDGLVRKMVVPDDDPGGPRRDNVQPCHACLLRKKSAGACDPVVD